MPEAAWPMSVRVGANMRRIRQERRLKMEDLVEPLREAGLTISISGISRLEKGQRQITVDELAQIAEVLDVTAESLYQSAIGGRILQGDRTGTDVSMFGQFCPAAGLLRRLFDEAGIPIADTTVRMAGSRSSGAGSYPWSQPNRSIIAESARERWVAADCALPPVGHDH